MTDGVVDLTTDGFDAAIGSGTWLVDFWAEWCGPCHALTPTLAGLAADRDDARIGKLETGDHPDVAERFGVQSLPTLIVFKDGEPVKRLLGVKNRRQLERALDVANGIVEEA